MGTYRSCIAVGLVRRNFSYNFVYTADFKRVMSPDFSITSEKPKDIFGLLNV